MVHRAQEGDVNRASTPCGPSRPRHRRRGRLLQLGGAVVSAERSRTTVRTAQPGADGAPTCRPQRFQPRLPAQTIGLTEWKVAVASTIKSGKTSYPITNMGTVPHELLVFKTDLAPSAFPTDATGDITEEGAGVELVSDGDNIDPSGSQTRSIDLTPGKYVFVCNIAGHFKQGMFTTVTVTP